MPKKKIVLRIPKNLVSEPIVYILVKDYNLIVNVLRAQVLTDEEGKILLEIEGKQSDIDNGLKYLKKQGIHVELLGKGIKIDENKCIDCGCCTAVCKPRALSINQTSWKLTFNRSRCVLCGLCVDACPMKIIQVNFDAAKQIS